MDWYYAAGGRQAGPVSDAGLADLVRSGVIRADTLVWHAGLTNWLPYGQVAAPPPPPPPAPAMAAPAPVAAAAPAAPMAGAATYCSECGRPYSPNDLVRFGDRFVCGNCKELFAQKLREGVTPRGAMVYAGFWIRFAAMFIDGLILGCVWAVLAFVVGFVTMGGFGRGSSPEGALAAMSVVLLLVYGVLLAGTACYEGFMVARSGATLGKKALGLKVVMPDGGPVSLGRAFGRYFAKIISGMPLYLGFIIAGFDSEKRGLHDYICSTRVIRT